jgi:hypothetical protein
MSPQIVFADMLILLQIGKFCMQCDVQNSLQECCIFLKGHVRYRILDIWDICRPTLIALGFDVKIGDVQPSCGRWSVSQVECIVNEDLFPSKDFYQIHINSDRVRSGFYLYYSFTS